MGKTLNKTEMSRITKKTSRHLIFVVLFSLEYIIKGQAASTSVYIYEKIKW